jgi:hypothetical protein
LSFLREIPVPPTVRRVSSYNNKDNKNKFGKTLHAAGVALITSSNEESNAFLFDEISRFSLERTELNLSQMATMLVQFLGPCFADVTRGIDDNSTNVNERTASMFLKHCRVGMGSNRHVP